MAIDDHPVEALRGHFELEDASAMPFCRSNSHGIPDNPASITVSPRQAG